MSTVFGQTASFDESDKPFKVTSAANGYDFNFDESELDFNLTEAEVKNAEVGNLNPDQIKAYDEFRDYAKEKWPGWLQ